MTKEKFLKDTLVVLDFIQTYCYDKHKEHAKSKELLELVYNNESVGQCAFELCATCKDIFFYSYARLQACPHEEKPRCRKCPHPCYEKKQWKTLAKIMRYSGMKKELVNVKNIFLKS